MKRMFVTMGAVGMMLAGLMGQLQAEKGDRDKTGTRSYKTTRKLGQTLENLVPARAGSILAEREGFEPSIPLRVYRFSRPTHSTTLPPLRN